MTEAAPAGYVLEDPGRSCTLFCLPSGFLVSGRQNLVHLFEGIPGIAILPLLDWDSLLHFELQNPSHAYRLGGLHSPSMASMVGSSLCSGFGTLSWILAKALTEASLGVNLRGLWSHARFYATNHDRHLRKRFWRISGPFSGKFCKENVWTSSEYFVQQSVSRFFRGHLQCDDRDNKDSDNDNSTEQIFLQHLSSLGIRRALLDHGQPSQFTSQFCSCAGLWNWEINMDISSAVLSQIEATSSCIDRHQWTPNGDSNRSCSG